MWACRLFCFCVGLHAVRAADAESGTCAAGGSGCSNPPGALEGVRDAVQGYFDALHSSNAEAFAKMWHPRGELLQTTEGKLTVLDAETFRGRVVKRAPSTTEDYMKHDSILSLAMLDDRTAAAKVRIVLPGPTAEPVHFEDFLVFLRDADGWRIISKVFAGKPLSQAQLSPRPMLPADFSAVASAVWDGYLAANRAGDAAKMREVFHPSARLTEVADEAVQVIASEEFLALVRDRWSLPQHEPYAHLRADPRAEAADTLLGVEFAGPDLALATLRVGFPPFLYTDVLTLARLGSEWMIVAKTSMSAAFLVDERKG